MTVETTFRITDPGIFWSIQTIDHLGKYSLAMAEIEAIEDAYLDTKKYRLLAAGYSCRRRSQGKGFLVTLTKLSKDADQKPKQWDVRLKKNRNSPMDWPKSQVRSRLLKVIPDKKLQVIFVLNQTRIMRQIKNGDQAIARINLDDVSLMIKGKEKHFKSLKLIIRTTDEEKHLYTLTKALQAKWPLEADPLSKFERAIAIEQKKAK